jgi:hypothetical protein
MIKRLAIVIVAVSLGVLTGFTHQTVTSAVHEDNGTAIPPVTVEPQQTPTPTPTPKPFSLFTDDFYTYVNQSSADISVAVYDHTRNLTFYYKADQLFKTVSIMKVSVMSALYLVQSNPSNYQSDLNLMIKESNNDAVTRLWAAAGDDEGITSLWSSLGMTHTHFSSDHRWGLTNTSASDQLKLLNALSYPNHLFRSSQQSEMLTLMEEVIPEQKWGVSGGVPADSIVSLKNGWSSTDEGFWRINSIGHVKSKQADYTIAVLTYRHETMEEGIETINKISAIIYNQIIKENA